MTRSYFIENITEWYELLDFCNDEECDLCEDLLLGDDLNSRINDDLYEAVRNWDWEDVRYSLNDISTGYDCYSCDGWLDYTPLDWNDFDAYKNDVVEWMDNGEYWDDEEDDETEEDFVFDTETTFTPDDDDDVPEEDFSVSELISVCLFEFETAQNAEKQRLEEQAKDERNALFALYS